MNEEKNERPTNEVYHVDTDGSLGLLAFGDLGLRAWREVKLKDKKKVDIDEKK